MPEKRGIDISRWQGDVDFGKVKASGISFLILRSSYRLTVDPMFHTYADGAKAAGIPVYGVYHFSYALNEEQAQQEAAFCISEVEKAGLGKDTILFFDFEYDTVDKAKAAGVTLGRKECNAHTSAFCEYAESRGYRAGIYSNNDYYKNMFDHDLLRRYVFWLADYSGGPNLECDYHQYTSSGSVPGISGKVDLDYCYEERKDGSMVRIGSARSNENGGINGGKAGDQTGGEVSTQDWYLHSKGWVVLRPKSAKDAEVIAKTMEDICANPNIGYCQDHRLSAYQAAEAVDFAVKEIKTPVEIDCSEAVRLCLAAAGIRTPDFNTEVEANVLVNTGKFDRLTDGKFCDCCEYLLRGDVLVTKKKGHTVVVLSDGPSGSRYSVGWNQDDAGWWYADTPNSYLKSCWAVINKHKYYFNSEGYAATGWQQIDGNWYFFENTIGNSYECALYVTDSDGVQAPGEF